MEFIDTVSTYVLNILSFEIFQIDSKPITAKSMLFLGLFLIFGFWLVKVLVRTIENRVMRIPNINSESMHLFIRTIHIGLGVLFLMISLNFFGIPISSLAFLSSAFIFGLGFGMQTLFSNFISGFIMIFEKTVTKGDFVEIDGQLGKIQHVNNRYTEILTPDLNRVLVPNSKFLENTFINWRNQNQTIRLKIEVGVAYGTDVELVRDLLLQVAEEDEYLFKAGDFKPVVIFRNFGDSALIFELYAFSRIQSRFEKIIRESYLRYAIDKIFKQHNITIAFPQMDLHLKSEKPVVVKFDPGERELIPVGIKSGKDPGERKE